MAGEQQTSQGGARRRRRRRGRGGNSAPAAGPTGNEQQQPRQGREPRGQAREPVETKEPRQPQPMPPQKPKRYGIVFYDTVMQARQDKENLVTKAKEFDQLNIVIRAESDMEDPELLPFGKIFAGAAWTLIHERRVQDGWYETPH